MPRRPSAALVLTVSVALATALVACNHEAGPASGEAQGSAVPPTSEIEDIQDAPSRYYGRRITLSGEIEDVRSARAFLLEGDGWIFDEGVLVLTRTPVVLGGETLADTDVIVTGTLQPMVAAEIERTLGWDLDPVLEAELDARPVLIADSIRAVDEVARWSERDDPEGTIVSLWSIYAAATPEVLAGRRVSIEDVPVQEKSGDGIWIGHGRGRRTFVSPPPGENYGEVQPGQWVSLTGVLRRMPPAEQAGSRWAIEPSDREEIEEQMLYIEALSIREVERGARRTAMQGGAGPRLASGPSSPGGGSAEDPDAPRDPITLEQFASAPADHRNEIVQGEATISRALSERALWLRTEGGNQAVLTLKGELGDDAPDFESGQRIRFTARSHGPDDSSGLGEDFRRDVALAIASQRAYLSADPSEVEVIEPSTDVPKG